MVTTQKKPENVEKDAINIPAYRKLITFKYHKPSELQGFIISLSGLFVSIFGFILVFFSLQFTAEQIKANTSAQGMTTDQNVMSHALDMDRIFIDFPDLRPYFFNGKEISPSDKNYNKVLSIADYQLDFFDTFFTEASYSARFENDQSGMSSWYQYMHDGFRNSPIMCHRLKAIEKEYTSDFVDTFKGDCPGDFGRS